jgi:hypothetical protein
MLQLFNYKIVIVICIQTFKRVRDLQVKSNGKPQLSPFYVYATIHHIFSHITFGSVEVI